MLAKTIGGVTNQLGLALDRSVAQNDRRGYFAAILWRATSLVTQGLKDGLFQYPDKVEQLHVLSTNRYLSAVRAWDQRRSMSYAWQAAFRCAEGRTATVATNLLVSYQAHVGIDCGVAMATALARGELNKFHLDYQRLSNIFDSLYSESYDDLSKDWPLFQSILKAMGKDKATLLGTYGPGLREHSWEFARHLSLKDPDDRDELIDSRDAACANESRSHVTPTFPTNAFNALLRQVERGTVPGIITSLRQANKPLISVPLRGAA